jgi:hypothetical protein
VYKYCRNADSFGRVVVEDAAIKSLTYPFRFVGGPGDIQIQLLDLAEYNELFKSS